MFAYAPIYSGRQTSGSGAAGPLNASIPNLGDLGVETAFGIIYPPQMALVGLGRVVQRPWVFDGRLEPRPVMTASVSADHRAVDGRRAGLFLGGIERWMQKPEAL